MNTPRPILAGQRLTAAYVNRLRAAAMSGANALGGSGVEVRQLDGSTHIALAHRQIDPALCVRCEYRMNAAEWAGFYGPAPRYGLVRYTRGYEGATAPALGECKAPDMPGLGRSLGVLQGYAADGAVAWVQTTGVTPVLYSAASGIARKGDRLGNQVRGTVEELAGEVVTGEQYLAVPNSLGPLTVIEDLGSATAFDPYGDNGGADTRWALCTLTGARGSSVMVEMGDGLAHSFEAIWFRNGLAVDHDAIDYPGMAYVQPVAGETYPQPNAQTLAHAAGAFEIDGSSINVQQVLGQIAEVQGYGAWTLTDGGDGVLIVDYAHAEPTTTAG